MKFVDDTRLERLGDTLGAGPKGFRQTEGMGQQEPADIQQEYPKSCTQRGRTPCNDTDWGLPRWGVLALQKRLWGSWCTASCA